MSDHLENARAYLAIAESSDAKREAYIKVADEIIAWLAEDPTRSNVQAGRKLGKREAWVRKLVTWRTSSSGRATPFSDLETNGEREARATRKVLREQPEVAAEIIEELLDQDGEAALAISRAVHKRDRAEKEEQQAERDKHDQLTAPTLPVYARTLLGRMREMRRALAAITDEDLEMLSERAGVNDLIDAGEGLQMELARWQLQLGGRIAIDADGTITIEVD